MPKRKLYENNNSNNNYEVSPFFSTFLSLCYQFYVNRTNPRKS